MRHLPIWGGSSSEGDSCMPVEYDVAVLKRCIGERKRVCSSS